MLFLSLISIKGGKYTKPIAWNAMGLGQRVSFTYSPVGSPPWKFHLCRDFQLDGWGAASH
ncbi:MAG: hypothetical protein WD032_09805 [Nitrospirales bacterium]